MINLTEALFPQPTLSFFLGGTGVLIGEQQLFQLEAFDPAQRAFIEPFFIDSQEPKIVDHARARHYCYTDLNQFFQPIYQEFTEQRFPENLGVSPVINSCEGCGVTRIFGTASLVACRDDFVRLVEEAVARLRKVRKTSTQPLQVFLTASACGGTGAGMILDAAALVRHYFRSRGENPRIFLFLVGPTVYFEDPLISMREDQKDRMRASTYALLKELNHFANGNPFVSAYRLRDQRIEIGNVADDDRLFDWVYFIDGRGEQAGGTRSLAEVVWSVAETQMHLAMTEVGRKVAESMPNQREERLRDYALHFIHPDNKDRLSKETRERLAVSSRKTFLASFAIRNVRFPAAEIKAFFRARWVRDAMQKALERDDPSPDVAEIDQFDGILGYVRGEFAAGGLLADLGLTREQLSARVSDEANPQHGMPAAPPPNATPDRAIGDTEAVLEAAQWVLADIKGESSLLTADEVAESGRMVATSTLVNRAVPRWNEIWREGLKPNGRVAERLLQIAWAPAGGRGLRYLDDFLLHTTDVLESLAADAKRRPGLAQLEEQIASAGEHLALVRKTRERERRGFRYLFRAIAARFVKQISADSENLVNRTKTLRSVAAALRQQLLEQRAAHLAIAIAPTVWLLAARHLKRWRDGVLSPMTTGAENAFTLADNRYELAREALKTYQGVNARGPWQSLSTVQLADDELLDSLGLRLRAVSVEDLVLAPLQAEGISRERERLTIDTLHEIDRERVVDMLTAHIDAHTRGRLTFLDNGWMLDEVRRRLGTTAVALDLGSEPLTSFSRPALGVQLQGYLLAPRELVLPDPFGRRLNRMNRLFSRDPLQLGVVSFVYGIPPNALEGMAELFEQYTIHLGDQQRNSAHDRFPLHIFRNAAEGFDEPHSPLTFQVDDDLVRSLLDAAQELWGHQIKLDIREFDPASEKHRGDWNRFVELMERLLRTLRRSPQAAEQLFRGGRFPELARLYNIRRHRSFGVPVDGNGNGAAASASDPSWSVEEEPSEGDA